MKAEFIAVITLFLLAGYYFAWSGRTLMQNRGSSITVSNGGDYEQIKYDGYSRFNDAETAIDSMTRGAFIHYRRNDTSISIECDKKGVIIYTFHIPGAPDPSATGSAPNPAQRRLLATAIKELISYGYDADDRIQRIARKGGTRALIAAIDDCKSDEIRARYIGQILQSDSLTLMQQDQWTSLLDRLSTFGSDEQKSGLLIKLAAQMPNDDQVRQAWLRTAKTIGSDQDYGRAIRALPAGNEKPLSL